MSDLSAKFTASNWIALYSIFCNYSASESNLNNPSIKKGDLLPPRPIGYSLIISFLLIKKRNQMKL